MEDVSRRSFLKGSMLAGALGAATVAGLTGCSTSGAETPTDGAGAAVSTKPEQTMSADVLVIGLGASGLMAALSAADKGAKVIAIDSESSFEGTTNTHTTGAWMIESEEQVKYPGYLTQQEAFEYIIAGTHYQCNGKVLRNIIRSSAQAANYLIDGGVSLMYAFVGSDANSPMLNRGGHVYMEEGEPRADDFRDMCAKRSDLATYFNCKATEMLKDPSGKVTGVICDNDGTVTEIDAKAVICCTGGFLSNEDMIKELFAGATIINQGFGQNDGGGIRMCQAVGAQIGKNFSVSCDEMGAGNLKANPQFAWAPGRNTSPCFYLPLFGNILVDKRGNRFMNEQQMAERTMYSGEPILRDPYYYTIIDSAYLKSLTTTPVFDMLTEGTKANMGMALLMGCQGVTLTDFQKDADQAISEGWAAKADSFEELARAFDMPDLPETLERYNDACAAGRDDEFFLPSDYLRPLAEGPYYIFEYNPGAWVTLGGIKTDGFCRAVDAENDIVEGLYVAGVDGDFWSVPYYQGGSCNGFSLASGVLAGNTAAEDVL